MSFLGLGLLPRFFLWWGTRAFWFGSTKLEQQTNLVALHIGKSNVGPHIRVEHILDFSSSTFFFILIFPFRFFSFVFWIVFWPNLMSGPTFGLNIFLIWGFSSFSFWYSCAKGNYEFGISRVGQDGVKLKEKKDGNHEIEGRFAKAPRELETIETSEGYAQWNISENLQFFAKSWCPLWNFLGL